MSTRPGRPALVGRTRPLVQTAGFVRKEIVDILRQPRLLLVLVAGPFLVLLMFAVGYDQQQAVLRTAFVGPEDGIYVDSMERFSDELEYYITNEGYGSDLASAERRLERGEVDVVVVLPEGPGQSVLQGEQAVVRIIHDKLDPIQQTAVEIAAQVAVQELNAQIVEAVVAGAQEQLAPVADNVARVGDEAARLQAAIASGNDAEVRAAANGLATGAAGLSAATTATSEVVEQLGVEQTEQQREQLAALTTSVDELEQVARRIAAAGTAAPVADIEAATAAVTAIERAADQALALDPAVLVRPFASETANIIRDTVGVNDYFAPASIALLLQHMVLTFAAMGLVKDRSLGLFEVFRVGPIGAGPVLLGKFLAYLLIGAFVGAALVAAVHYGLDVPMRGELVWLVIGMGGLVLASIGAGMVLSLLARSETQAVQYAMLALLAGLFFGGFFLDLDALRYPVKAVSWALPVTYGVRIMRDVMLRGLTPTDLDLIGLAATTVVFALWAWWLMSRRLRVQ